jgi:YidC/Oxa1 family membrane protein insertase
MMGAQFWMQVLTPMPSVDPAQARMMKFMPLMMGVIFWGFQSGLVIYWLTMNLVGVGQQVILNKMPGDDLEIEIPGRKPNRKKK